MIHFMSVPLPARSAPPTSSTSVETTVLTIAFTMDMLLAIKSCKQEGRDKEKVSD